MTIAVRNPRTGDVDFEFAPASAEVIARTVASLRDAQRRWFDAGVEYRCSVLARWADELDAQQDRVSAALSIDTGRRAIAVQETQGCIRAIRRWCEMAPGLMATRRQTSMALPRVTLSEQLVPYPVAGVISPWNFPLTLSLIDAVPALLAGSAVLIKPSEITPRFVEPLLDTVRSIDELMPVLNLVLGGAETGRALVESVDAVAFTGSIATGRAVGEAAARAFIPAFLELGGKDPAIVLAGADLDQAVQALLRASVIATGQACQSIERIYVQRDLHDEFVERLVEAAGAVELTWPDPDRGHLGPFIDPRQADKVAAQLADAVDRGAHIECGGRIERHGGGYWLRPTVVSGVNHDMALMREETFGPVAPVMAFDTEDEALALANDSTYGLSGCLFGPDAAHCERLAQKLDAGGVSINDASLTTMIFEAEKNAFKQSGLGASRMGASGLTRFLRRKAIYLNSGPVMALDAVREEG